VAGDSRCGRAFRRPAEQWGQARDAGLWVEVGGFSTSMLDFDSEMFGSLHRVIPLVLAVTFIALVFAFRSIVVPIKAITILFGLSMDYEVFLLSRIREEYRRTGDNAKSVITGLSQTGGLITSAALIMVVLFGSFGFTRLTATREFGLGLAFAVALDATLIRVVLVPILMGLLGCANCWFPATLLRRRNRRGLPRAARTQGVAGSPRELS
jgi:uncharacterized membrane protein YdfJ with MMPL/SSD domain